MIILQILLGVVGMVLLGMLFFVNLAVGIGGFIYGLFKWGWT